MTQLSQLGRYQLVRVLGRGAMGVVYEGLDPKLNRQVAVKIIAPQHGNDELMKAEYSARFLREAQAVARLSHSNIVTVFDFGEENHVMYIVMEYIQGAELKESFDRHHEFSLNDVVGMTCELLDALEYAHDKGIVHRDIKPANVMLDAQGHVKLTDFGVARLSESSGENKTMVGTMVGTPSYMSPEQIAGVAVGPRSDLFAVGVILYQFLTGEKPFQASGSFATQQKIMQEDPQLPSQLNTRLGNSFDCVLFRALAKRPEDRYQSARAFKEDLKRAFAGEALQEGNTLPLRSPSPYVQAHPASANDAQEHSSHFPARQVANGAMNGTGTGLSLALDADAVSAGLELEFWRSINLEPDAEQYALYLQRYPQGVYAALAQRKLARLRGEESLPLQDPLAAQEASLLISQVPQVSQTKQALHADADADATLIGPSPFPAANLSPVANPLQPGANDLAIAHTQPSSTKENLPANAFGDAPTTITERSANPPVATVNKPQEPVIAPSSTTLPSTGSAASGSSRANAPRAITPNPTNLSNTSKPSQPAKSGKKMLIAVSLIGLALGAAALHFGLRQKPSLEAQMLNAAPAVQPAPVAPLSEEELRRQEAIDAAQLIMQEAIKDMPREIEVLLQRSAALARERKEAAAKAAAVAKPLVSAAQKAAQLEQESLQKAEQEAAAKLAAQEEEQRRIAQEVERKKADELREKQEKEKRRLQMIKDREQRLRER